MARLEGGDGPSITSEGAVKGDPDAPVTITEWSDYECPFCLRHYQQTLPQIEELYIKTGKVKYEFKDFPLNFHPNAQKAAEAAKCAGEQEEYWAMHDRIFDEKIDGQAPTVDNLKLWAADLGLNAKRFSECLDSGRMAGAVQAEMAEGQTKGIGGTPGFLINGKLVSGAQPFSAFQQAIDAALAEQ